MAEHMDPMVDQYLLNGCGRCAHYKTLQCKVHTWTAELRALRQLALECGLEESFKWSQPCYTFQNRNVLLVTAFKDYACMAFFKGTLLSDKAQILVSPGKHSQAARQLRFTSTQDIKTQASKIKAFIHEAIDIEKKGRTVPFNKSHEEMPNELRQIFEKDPGFEAAFMQLTPGRQRGYILHFAQPKQSKTRIGRIEKWKPLILEGKGMQDAYKAGHKKQSVMSGRQQFESVEAYFQSQPNKTREVLMALRACILEVVPDAEELINYGIPAYALVPGGKRDQQIMIAGFKNHVGFYPHPVTMTEFESALSAYKSGKGSVQLPLGQPLPVDLIRRMVTFRVKSLESRRSKACRDAVHPDIRDRRHEE